MFIYMGMIEQKINELLQAFVYIKSKQGAPIYNLTEEQDQILHPTANAASSRYEASVVNASSAAYNKSSHHPS